MTTIFCILLGLWLTSPLIYKVWAWWGVFVWMARGVSWRVLLVAAWVAERFESLSKAEEKAPRDMNTNNPADDLGWS